VTLPPIGPQPASESKLLDILGTRRGLIVSLPRNDPALAIAAAAGGADALKVHIHVHHEASGTHFGSLDQERPALEAIMSQVAVPVGIVPGAETIASREEMQQLKQMGVDFFDAYAHHMPAWMLKFDAMACGVALEASYSVHDIVALEALGADFFEAAVIPHEGYGKPLTALDVAVYRSLRAAASRPIIVPTQRKMEPSDAALLTKEIGIDAVMIGAIVTGGEPSTVERTTALFRAAIAP